jgi:hypothetical protein
MNTRSGKRRAAPPPAPAPKRASSSSSTAAVKILKTFHGQVRHRCGMGAPGSGMGVSYWKSMLLTTQEDLDEFTDSINDRVSYDAFLFDLAADDGAATMTLTGAGAHCGDRPLPSEPVWER